MLSVRYCKQEWSQAVRWLDAPCLDNAALGVMAGSALRPVEGLISLVRNAIEYTVPRVPEILRQCGRLLR